jgi:hypothetical protein
LVCRGSTPLAPRELCTLKDEPCTAADRDIPETLVIAGAVTHARCNVWRMRVAFGSVLCLVESTRVPSCMAILQYISNEVVRYLDVLPIGLMGVCLSM